MFFLKPLKMCYVFANCSCFCPILLLSCWYAVTVLKLLVKRKLVPVLHFCLSKAKYCLLDMFHTTSLVSSSVVCTSEVKFLLTNKGPAIRGNIVFCSSQHFILSAASRDREVHGEERRTTVDSPDWRKDIY